MSTPFRYRAELMAAWSLLGLCGLAIAQRPAPRNPRDLLPQERQFLELDVDLGKSAPFPTPQSIAVSPNRQAPSPREVARQSPAPIPVAQTSTPIEVGTVKWRRDFESAKRRPFTASMGTVQLTEGLEGRVAEETLETAHENGRA